MSPVLPGGFFTTEPPGKPPVAMSYFTFKVQVYFQLGPRTLASCQQKLRGAPCGAVHQPTGQLQD